MKRTTYIAFALLALHTIHACRQELRPKEDFSLTDSEMRFNATEYEAVPTRSAGAADRTRSIFIGMAGKDSLFICASESDMTSAPLTRSDDPDIPANFHISAFLDNAQSPYIATGLSSTDRWMTYSPTLYWPENYESIHFFAYTYDVGNNPVSPIHSTAGDVFTTEFEHTVPHSSIPDSDAEVQPDLMFAISPSQREENEPVDLCFTHVLSAIEFKIGSIGQAEVVSSTATISGIRTKGRCHLTYPISEENISWTADDESGSYSQTVKDDVSFMVIPQVLTDTGASFEISVRIGDIVHEFPSKRLSEITSEWKPGRKYTYTITKGGEVRVDVRDEHSDIVKENVRIQNTGFTTAYIRAAVVGYWYVTGEDGAEEIASSWDVNDSNAGTLAKASDWSSHWKEIDGFYYHIEPVAPGAYTAPLFDSYKLEKTTGPVSGSRLSINIAVQAVEATEKAAEYWPVN